MPQGRWHKGPRALRPPKLCSWWSHHGDRALRDRDTCQPGSWEREPELWPGGQEGCADKGQNQTDQL